MTPEQFDGFLTVAKKHGVSIVRIGDVVLGGPAAPVEMVPVPFVPGGPPDPPKLDLKGDSNDPVARWDSVDAALFLGGLQT